MKTMQNTFINFLLSHMLKKQFIAIKRVKPLFIFLVILCCSVLCSSSIFAQGLSFDDYIKNRGDVGQTVADKKALMQC
jgi:hypothetical protein